MDIKTNPGYLLHHLAFALDRQSDQLLQDRLDMGFSQFKILMTLKWRDGMRQRKIAEALGQTEASISRQIKLMVEMGLLKSRTSPKNRREHIITLTGKGERRAEKAMQVLNAYHAPMFERLSAAQQRNLTDSLNIMHAEVCRTGRAGACDHNN